MIPTLRGRIQTRIFAVLVIGGLWTLLITPVLPGLAFMDLGEAYEMTFSILLTVLVLGLGWELVYHFLQQFRWEKDWPTLFGLVTIFNEGVVLWLVLRSGVVPAIAGTPPASAWLTHFVSTWLVIFLWLNGPMKVVFIRWRFRGGSFVG
jgi:hypothetical protein